MKHIRLECIIFFIAILLSVITILLSIQSALMRETISTMQMTIETQEKALSVLREQNVELSTELENKKKELEELAAKPTGDYDIFAIAGDAYEVDSVLLEAICRWESGHFTSKLYKTKNNAWGAYDGKNWLSFNNPEHSILELARTLRKNYYDRGLDTIEEIAKVYCPNSPESWTNGVKSIYDELKNAN